MSRRHLLLAATLIVLMVTGVVVAWVAWPRSSRSLRESARRIDFGMTLAEVEQVLGGSAAGASTRRFQDGAGRVQLWTRRIWLDDGFAIRVQFDTDERVVSRTMLDLPTNSIVEKARRWLRL